MSLDPEDEVGRHFCVDPAQKEEEKALEEDDMDVLLIDCVEWLDQEPSSLPPTTRIKGRLPQKSMPLPKK